ncbi:SPW repeat-containing protein [Arthrobacter sp. SLBN-112]|uniref:SPW repeat domain-containing protein n=1 Tax=Arthrobacter sp. SLBN-112 TaxID=2768452 RepID=UPI001153B4F6|nr:SPW repeat protein [Arthrobacter sp. SLBN-112]TQJ38180.1 SPW repeat-containing protein [Arthrobacter sp. SLBN-112]
MKKWYRWQDYVTVAAGLFTAIAVLWTRQQDMSTTFMLLFGGLLIISGVINLAMPGTPVMEYAQAALAALLILSPWMGSYTGAMGAAWTSWIAGAVALVVTAAAIKPSTDAHHNLRMSH